MLGVSRLGVKLGSEDVHHQKYRRIRHVCHCPQAGVLLSAKSGCHLQFCRWHRRQNCRCQSFCRFADRREYGSSGNNPPQMHCLCICYGANPRNITLFTLLKFSFSCAHHPSRSLCSLLCSLSPPSPFSVLPVPPHSTDQVVGLYSLSSPKIME
jgi:hypothetical protein